jgi:hypothetical protein
MTLKPERSINHYMRVLHRDIGFFVIGITIIYGISGIVLLYRDTHFFRNEITIEKELSPNLSKYDLFIYIKTKYE